ncbi:MAG: hypothetical protein WAV11_03745 [Minisyncoccia bacterium]
MEQTRKIEQKEHEEYILDNPRKARVLAIENIAKVPGLGDFLKSPEIDTGDILFVDFREINTHLMNKTAKFYDEGETREIIIALSGSGDVIGEIDKIPRKDEGILASLIDFFNPSTEEKHPEDVLSFLKRLDEQKVREIASIVSIVPTGKILVYRRPPGFKDMHQWLNTNEKEITKKFNKIDS